MNDQTPDDQELLQSAIAQNRDLGTAAVAYATKIGEHLQAEGVAAHCIVMLTKFVPDPVGPGGTLVDALGHCRNYGTKLELIQALQRTIEMLEEHREGELS